MSARIFLLIVLLNIGGLPDLQAQNSARPRKAGSVLGPDGGDVNKYRPVTVLGSAIRPITDPAIVSAAESGLSDNELVIGVVVNGKARAYPINQLTGPQREIINDRLGGTAIAATW